MRVETIRSYESRLPEHDPHPYRTGAWTPNTVEVDAYELDVVAGELPDDLAPVLAWRTAVSEAGGVLIASPEYAHSLPGSLKNALAIGKRFRGSTARA